MFASRIRGAAENAGLQFKLSGNLPDTDTDAIQFVIIDLASRSGVLPGIVDEVASKCPQAKLIAYGPHVQIARLKLAREAGVPTVLTRGQFDASLTNLFSCEP